MASSSSSSTSMASFSLLASSYHIMYHILLYSTRDCLHIVLWSVEEGRDRGDY